MISADITPCSEMTERGAGCQRFVGADDSTQRGAILHIGTQPQNKMNMVGHDHKIVQANRWKTLRKRIPCPFRNGSHSGHFKIRFAPIQTCRHKIRPRSAIIIPLETNRTPVIFHHIVIHLFAPLSQLNIECLFAIRCRGGGWADEWWGRLRRPRPFTRDIACFYIAIVTFVRATKTSPCSVLRTKYCPHLIIYNRHNYTDGENIVTNKENCPWRRGRRKRPHPSSPQPPPLQTM